MGVLHKAVLLITGWQMTGKTRRWDMSRSKFLAFGLVFMVSGAFSQSIAVAEETEPAQVEWFVRMGDTAITSQILGQIDEAVRAYHKKTGKLPASLNDLMVVSEDGRAGDVVALLHNFSRDEARASHSTRKASLLATTRRQNYVGQPFDSANGLAQDWPIALQGA